MKKELAEKSSQTNWCASLSPQDTPWALFKQEAGQQQRIPVGEQCYACFDLHDYFFSYLDWSGLVAKQKADPSFAEMVTKARTKRAADNHLEKGQAVESEVCVEFEVSKPFLVGNIGELPNEQGVTETVYVFGSESDEGLRSANLKVKVNTHLVKTHLSSSDFLEPHHTEEVMNHALAGSSDKSGLTNLLNKVPWLQTFAAWEEKKLGSTDVAEEGKSLEEAVQEASSALVGPAASLVSEPPPAHGTPFVSGWQKFFTPPKANEKMGLSRAATEEWSGSRASDTCGEKQANSESSMPVSLVSGSCKNSVAGTEDASTCMGEEGYPSVVADQTLGVWLCARSLECLRACPCACSPRAVSADVFGDDTLAYWKSKLNLSQLALGKQDKRSKPALRRAIQRLSSKKEHQADATILSGFKSQVNMAEELVSGVIANCTVGRIQDICNMLVAEDHAVPEHVKVHLLQRKIDDLKASKRWEELLVVAGPFEVKTFDLKNPSIAGLSSKPEQKIELYQQHFFNEVIIPLILAGEHELQTVVELSSLSIKLLSNVDVVELEQLTSVVYDECMCIFRTLLSLLEPSLSSHEVSKD
eukprot:4853248-Amphidinium_carterae.5